MKSMIKRFRKKKSQEKSIAMERIKELFKQAEAVYIKKPGLASSYVALARRISTRTKTRIPRELKRRFCKHCGSYLHVGTTVRIRLSKGKKIYFCMNCGKYTRIPYK